MDRQRWLGVDRWIDELKSLLKEKMFGGRLRISRWASSEFPDCVKSQTTLTPAEVAHGRYAGHLGQIMMIWGETEVGSKTDDRKRYTATRMLGRAMCERGSCVE
jgi:hypothetical protein